MDKLGLQTLVFVYTDSFGFDQCEDVGLRYSIITVAAKTDDIFPFNGALVHEGSNVFFFLFQVGVNILSMGDHASMPSLSHSFR
jgi:hypothetical protein